MACRSLMTFYYHTDHPKELEEHIVGDGFDIIISYNETIKGTPHEGYVSEGPTYILTCSQAERERIERLIGHTFPQSAILSEEELRVIREDHGFKDEEEVQEEVQEENKEEVQEENKDEGETEEGAKGTIT